MTDPDLTPREDEVRRLLAQARHDEPLPEHVAGRLDEVLADLQATEPPRPVADLAAARRRRARIRTGLVAAAAAVLVGVGISQVDLSGLDADSADAGGSADSSVAQEESAPEPAPLDADEGAAGAPDLLGLPTPVRLRSDRLEQQVRGLVAAAAPLASSGARSEERPQTDAAADCPTPPGLGRPVAATYDGAPAVLVIGPVAGGVRMVDLYLCGESTPTRSVTVPVG